VQVLQPERPIRTKKRSSQAIRYRLKEGGGGGGSVFFSTPPGVFSTGGEGRTKDTWYREVLNIKKNISDSEHKSVRGGGGGGGGVHRLLVTASRGLLIRTGS